MTDQSQPDQRDQSATRRCVLLCAGALGATSVLTACSTAFVPYDADGAGHAPSMGAAPQGGAGGGMGSAAAMPSGTRNAKTGGSKKQTAGKGPAKDNTAKDNTAKDKTAKNKTTGTVLGMAADIPVGGGKIYTTAKVVVTQPAKGEFKAFSAICTHVGCLCNQVTDGTINCPCHGAKFKITDGSVVTGPAPTALAAKAVTVANGKIFLQ